MRSFIGYHEPFYAKVLFVIFACIAGILFATHVYSLQRLKILPVYVLPLLSFCVCYENVVLYYGCDIKADSNVAKAGYLFHSLIIPLFVVTIYELAYRLHEARSAQFFFIPFDQDIKRTRIIGITTLWIVRTIAAGLFVMNILVDYRFIDYQAKHSSTGGYEYLSNHSSSVSLWLALIPPIFLSLVSIVIGFSLHRYGKYNAFRLEHSRVWRLFLIGAFAQTVSQIFGFYVYSVTANAGEVALLICSTGLLYLVQEELIDTGNFADFLHQSNIAFSHLSNEPNNVEHFERIAEDSADAQQSQNSTNKAVESVSQVTEVSQIELTVAI